MARMRGERDPDASNGRGGRGRRAPSEPSTAASLAPGSPASLLHLQRAAGNQAVAGLVAGSSDLPIQRVKDGFGEKLSTTNLALAQAFKNKHVADDEQGAIATTDWRYQNKKMPKPMEQGRMSNTVAPADTWLGALDASDTQVDTGDAKWTKGVKMDVPKAWEVRWQPRTEDYGVREVASLALAAGGYGEALVAGRGRNSRRQVVDGKFLVDHIEQG